MNAALRKQCGVLRRLFARAGADEIRTRYRIAAIVLSVQRRADRYGARAVDRLGAALRCDRATLYRHGQVAKCFERRALDDILRRASRRAPNFSWSHLVLLAGVDEAGERARFLEQALSGLSVRELERAMQEREAVPSSGSLTALALRRLCAATELFKGRASIDVDVDGEAPTQEVIQLVGQLADAQDELREICERNVRALRQAREDLVRKVKPAGGAPLERTRSRLLAG